VLRHAAGVKGQAASGSNREGESTEAGRRGGAARSSVEGPVMGLERRGCVVRPWPLANWKREEPVDEAKPFKDVMSWQRPNIGSRVTREGHARFWERPEVKFLRATRQTSPFRNEGGKVRNRRRPAATRAIIECGGLPHRGHCPERVGGRGGSGSYHSFSRAIFCATARTIEF
jgi:hypothetical protein